MSPPVAVDEQLLEHARDPEREALRLLVRVNGAPEETISALKEMLLETAVDADWRGGWSWVRRGCEVMLQIRKSADAPRELLDLAERLRQRGLTGRLEPYQDPELPPITVGAYKLQAFLRVGQHSDEEVSGWDRDPSALEQVVRRAVRWCLEDARDAPVFSKTGVASFSLRPDEDPVARMLEELFVDRNVDVGLVSLRCATSTGTRTVEAAEVLGEVTLTDRPRPDAGLVWATQYAELREVLRETAPLLAYGLVKNGSNPTYDSMFAYDWPPRPGLDSRGQERSRVIDTAAPDAFALQVLGPGYRDRIPASPSYFREAIGEAVILEHRDLDAWFSAPLVPFGTDFRHVASVEPPAVLAAAREELAPILHTSAPV